MKDKKIFRARQELESARHAGSFNPSLTPIKINPTQIGSYKNKKVPVAGLPYVFHGMKPSRYKSSVGFELEVDRRHRDGKLPAGNQ